MEQFEKNIKEKLNERKIHSSVQAWDKLEMMLNEQEAQIVKKKSPRTYLFIAASLLVFVSLGTFFFKMNSDSIEPNVIQIQPTENWVIEENRNEEIHEFLEEETIPSKEISESKINKAKSENKAVTHLNETGDKPIESKVVTDFIEKQIVKFDQREIAQVIEKVDETEDEIPASKVDPKKLLMVAEYEKNVEKSASQFKQMKHKFEEVKTALNNINQ